MRRLIVCLAFLAALGLAGAHAATLDKVRQRGELVCGSNPGLAGFGIPDSQGRWTGLDIDYCRAIAAAVFNDPNKVRFTPLTEVDRFTALQSGEVDILAHNSTWTESREVGLGLLFAAVNYYDGQGFMVKKSLGVTSALQLNGASICVQQGTTTELNLADYFKSHGMTYQPVTFGTGAQAIRAFDSGRCDAFTTDQSGLYAERLNLTNPASSVILPQIISKEPLSPVVRRDDDQWFDIARWTQFAMVDAEELGVTRENVDEMRKSKNPAVRRLLGLQDDFGKGMGLSKDWAYRIVKDVGNYGEIFDRDVGKDSKLKIKRGLNRLWSKGGLMYAPPIR